MRKPHFNFRIASTLISWFILIIVVSDQLASAAVPVLPGSVADLPRAKPANVIGVRFGTESLIVSQDLLQGATVKLSESKAEYQKLTVLLSTPQAMKSVSIESCGGEFNDGVEFFFDPGQRRAFVEGGKPFALAPLPDDRGVTALSIVFRHQNLTCLKGFRVLDRTGHSLLFALPDLEPAKLDNDDVRRLFDMAFFLPSSFSGGMTSSFVFDVQQDVDRVLVWTGDELSDESFKQSPKLTGLSLSADGGRPQRLQLANKSGLQEIVLKTPLQGRRFTLSPAASADVSEMRLGWRTRTFLPYEASTPEKNPTAKVKKLFADSDLSDALDKELVSKGDREGWRFRFRGDSTFFVYGDNEDRPDVAGHVNGLGRFEVLLSQPKKIKLHLRGIKLEASAPWDGWVCGPACGESTRKRETMIDETIVLEKIAGGYFMVRNRNPLSKRTLLFTDLKSKVSSLAE